MKRAISCLGFLLVSLMASTILGHSAQVSDATSRSDLLERRVEGSDLELLTTPHAFLKSLHGARAPGGIVRVCGCEDDLVMQRWQPSGSLLSDLLDWMVRADPQYHWSVEDDVINLLPKATEPALLKTRINAFKLRRVTSASMALNRLMATPEVRSAITKLNLNERLKVMVASVPKSPTEGRYSLDLKEITLRSALNAIARAGGNTVWEYRETHCAGKDEFSVDFIVE